MVFANSVAKLMIDEHLTIGMHLTCFKPMRYSIEPPVCIDNDFGTLATRYFTVSTKWVTQLVDSSWSSKNQLSAAIA